MMMMIDHDVVANYTCTHNETKNGGKKEKKVGVGKGLAVRMKKKTVSAIETNASPENLRLIGTRSLKLRFQVHGLETTVDMVPSSGGNKSHSWLQQAQVF